jgi:hypothetical protein
LGEAVGGFTFADRLERGEMGHGPLDVTFFIL